MKIEISREKCCYHHRLPKSPLWELLGVVKSLTGLDYPTSPKEASSRHVTKSGCWPWAAAAAAAESLQSCPTLWDPIDGSPPGSPVPGILQATTLEWVAISFSNAWKWKVKVKLLSRVWHFVTPWTAAYQAPPSMGFSRQEYCSGVPLPSPGPELRLRYLQSIPISTHEYVLCQRAWLNDSVLI